MNDILEAIYDYSYDRHYYDINANINPSIKVKIQKITSYGSQKSWEPRVKEKIGKRNMRCDVRNTQR